VFGIFFGPRSFRNTDWGPYLSLSLSLFRCRPDVSLFSTQASSKTSLRNIFSHCVATRATNQAARDYRRWFCDADHS